MLHAEFLLGGAGVYAGNFSAPPFFPTAADAAMPHAVPSNPAETWLIKALFALPHSLQLPRLAAQDRWKLCREAEIQECM